MTWFDRKENIMVTAIDSAQPAVQSDSNKLLVTSGTSASHVVRAAGLPTQGDSAIVIVVDDLGQERDLSWVPDKDTWVTPIAINTEQGRAVLRHSTAHVFAQATQELFPQAKLGIGPPIKDGFYYDILIDTPFTPEDLTAISAKMKKIIKSGQKFVRRVLESKEAAKEEFAHEPLRLELIEDKSASDDPEILEVGGNELTAYDNCNPRTNEVIWKDLCRGPHVPTTKHIPAFKLLRTSAAYWRGDQNNVGLQRVYGTAWENNEAQEQYLFQLEEAAKRDHRRVGSELDLFSFPAEIGSGLPVFHPHGAIIRHELEQYSMKRHKDNGYQLIYTPHITKSDIFQTSGHLDWYREGMYPAIHMDEECDDEGHITKPGQDYYLKPMNCPMHNLVFKSRGRSYRELPLRLFEFGTVYRYEKSGVVQGLTRARGFTQDDAHIYCTEDQLEDELINILKFVLSLLSDYGLTEYYLELSTRDPEKSVGSDAIWEKATSTLERVAIQSGLSLYPDPGGAAFYGPKISVQAKDAIGRTWQMSTIQLDFNLPERFDLEYTASDGTKKRPIMIHRALFGSVERFFGVLTEHYGGAFPAWLSPVQVMGIPVAETFADHLQKVIDQLRSQDIRAELDYSHDRMQKKIRTHTTHKIPFMLLAGERDQLSDAVSFRFRDGSQINGVPTDQAVQAIARWVREKNNASPQAENFAEYVNSTVQSVDEK